jgi:hypothetical protein
MSKNEIRYWKISPGGGGFLWREQQLNKCIAIGWSEIGNAKGLNEEALRNIFLGKNYTKREAIYAASQLDCFINKVSVGDKAIASASGKGIYAVGTIIGEYDFNDELEYRHSRKVQWETIFWHPVDIGLLGKLPESLYNKFHGQSSQTIRELEEKEWDKFCDRLNKVPTPFRNLGMWAGMIQSPEYENEVMILFSHMLQHFGMRIIQFATRFPDAIVERKKGKKWEKLNVEFELWSSGFQDHLPDEDKKCDIIVCWENNDWGRNERQKEGYEIIELKEHLEKIL